MLAGESGLMSKDKCPECESTDTEWSWQNCSSEVAEGRLRTNEVTPLFILGCNACSETIKVMKVDQVVSMLNAKDGDKGITEEMLNISRPSDDNTWHWAANLTAILEHGYCPKCKMTPRGCVREGCGVKS